MFSLFKYQIAAIYQASRYLPNCIFSSLAAMTTSHYLLKTDVLFMVHLNDSQSRHTYAQTRRALKSNTAILSVGVETWLHNIVLH